MRSRKRLADNGGGNGPQRGGVMVAEAGTLVRAFVEPVGVGDSLVDIPLFPGRGRYVVVPLAETYDTAFASVPRRWRTVLGPQP